MTRDDLAYALPTGLTSYRVYQLPAASLWAGASLYVSDEVGGAVNAYSDGANWRRVTDRTVVSAITAVALSGIGRAVATLRGSP